MRLVELTKDRLKRVPDTDKLYTCNVNIDWELGHKGSGNFIVVKKGKPFDVSTPKWLEWAANPHGSDLLFCAAIHDQMLEDGTDAAVSSAEFRRALVARGYSGAASWRLFFATLFWTI